MKKRKNKIYFSVFFKCFLGVLRFRLCPVSTHKEAPLTKTKKHYLSVMLLVVREMSGV